MFVSYTVTVGSFLRNIVKSVFKRQTVCMSVRGVKILATAPPPPDPHWPLFGRVTNGCTCC